MADVEHGSDSEQPLAVGSELRFSPGDYSHIINLRSVRKVNPYAKFAACTDVLSEAVRIFDITGWRLGKLLGMRWPHATGPWFRGEQRPSQTYCIRLLKLHQLVLQGLDLRKVDYIDWDGGNIVYKEGVKTRGTGDYPIPATQRQISAGNRGGGNAMAKFLNQPGR